MLIKGNKHLIKMFESLPRNKVQIRMASVSGSVVHRGFWVDLRIGSLGRCKFNIVQSLTVLNWGRVGSMAEYKST